ncbi:hypothetical protein DL96DRAFT_1681956 [Flagelloscypha sp. PMI_526]|nr:hypothetical protein DL96DRAFT_1681956 [Flagelloscypha sp. PMI_526]
MFLLLLLSLVSLFLSTSFVQAKHQYYIDDTNTTAWSFSGKYVSDKDSMAYNESYTACHLSLFFPNAFSSNLSAPLTGSSIEIFGVAFEAGVDTCHVDFSWPFGNTTHTMNPTFKNPYNLSYAHAEGFNPDEVSSVTFVVRSCLAYLDYAVVTVEDSDSATPSTSGAVVGGVIGGLVILSLLLSGIWIKYRHRKKTDADGITSPAPMSNPMIHLPLSRTISVSHEDQARIMASTPSNSLSSSAREKQGFVGASVGIATRVQNLSVVTADGESSSEDVSKTQGIEQPMSLTRNSSAVQARLSHLRAEILEIETRGTLPPPY